MAARILWYIKQLVPCTYWTTYGEVQEQVDGKTVRSLGPEHFVIWKMWLGRCYDVIDFSEHGVATMGNARASSPPLPS